MGFKLRCNFNQIVFCSSILMLAACGTNEPDGEADSQLQPSQPQQDPVQEPEPEDQTLNVATSASTFEASLVASDRTNTHNFELLVSPNLGYVYIDENSGDVFYRPTDFQTGQDSFSVNVTNTVSGHTHTITYNLSLTSPAGHNLCASRIDADGVQQSGIEDDWGHCHYDRDFAASGNPVLDDLHLKNIGNAAHIFEGSLFIGRNFTSNVDLESFGLFQGGDGNKLTIDAGVTIGFFDGLREMMVINRGSQIFARGTKDSPIVITSVNDLFEEFEKPEDIPRWGGLNINGFGVTNRCQYLGTLGESDFSLDVSNYECHVASDGPQGLDESHYGGDNNLDNSGVLSYLIIKHAGVFAGANDELNGISFAGVGAGTTVNYIQTYMTYDDGIEFFGGAVNVNNYIGLYNQDDAIDIDEGYQGTINNALVIQSETDGNRCVEADGIGTYSKRTESEIETKIAQGLNSRPTINNLSCIVSPTELFDFDLSPHGTGTHDPGQGIRLREAIYPTINNALITTTFLPEQTLNDTDRNYCLRITDKEGEEAILNDNGNVSLNQFIIACQDLSDTSNDLSAAEQINFIDAKGGQTIQTNELGEDPTARSNPDLILLDSFYSVETPIIDGAPTTVELSKDISHGAISRANDWARPWAFGLFGGNKHINLYFE